MELGNFRSKTFSWTSRNDTRYDKYYDGKWKTKGRGRLRLEIGPPLKVLGDHLLPSIPTRWFRKTTNRTSLGGQYPTKSLIFQPTIWVRHTYPEPYACRRGMHAHSENLSDRCNFSRSTTLQAVPPLPEVALTVMWSENHRKSKILPVVDLFRDF